MDRLNFIQGTSLYIRNLDDCVDDERLRKEFSVFGVVTSAKVMTESGRSKGFGFVSFATAEQARMAMKQMNGRFIGPLPIYIALAHRREDRRAIMTAHFGATEGATNATKICKPQTLSHYSVPPSTGTQEREELEATVSSIKNWWPDESVSRVEHPVENNINSGRFSALNEPTTSNSKSCEGFSQNKIGQESSVQNFPQVKQDFRAATTSDFVTKPLLNFQSHDRFGNPLSTGNGSNSGQKPVYIPFSPVNVATGNNNTEPRPITNKNLSARPGSSQAGEHIRDLNRMLPRGVIDEIGLSDLYDFSYDKHTMMGNTNNQPPISTNQESNNTQVYHGQYPWASKDTSFLKYLSNMELLNNQKNSYDVRDTLNTTLYGTESRPASTNQGSSNMVQSPSFMMTDRPIDGPRPLYNRQPVQGFPPNNPAFVEQSTNFDTPWYNGHPVQEPPYNPQGFMFSGGNYPGMDASLLRAPEQAGHVRPSSYEPTIPIGNDNVRGSIPNQAPFYVPVFPVPEERPVMPPNYSNMHSTAQPYYTPELPSINGQSMIVPTRHGAREGYFAYPDPSTIPEFLQNGQGLIMTANETTLLSNEELTKILKTNGLVNHDPVNSRQVPGAGKGVRKNTGRVNTENFTLPRSTTGQPSGVQVIPLVAQGVVLTGGNRTVAFQFTSNVRNAPKGYCLWQADPAKAPIPENILTEKMLAAAEPTKRRELLGERLYPIIFSMYSDMAAKITGMLLELDNARLLHMLDHIGCLKEKVDEAAAVIRYHQAKEAAEAVKTNTE